MFGLSMGKAIIAGLGALAIVSAVGAGFAYVRHLQQSAIDAVADKERAEANERTAESARLMTEAANIELTIRRDAQLAAISADNERLKRRTAAYDRQIKAIANAPAPATGCDGVGPGLSALFDSMWSERTSAATNPGAQNPGSQTR